MYQNFSWYKQRQTFNAGFSFIEVLVTVAIVGLVFGGLLNGYATIVQLIGESRLKSGALALATEQIEYIKSLPYADIGTIAGVPAGVVPQNSSSTLNSIAYDMRVLIVYVDDPADGLGGSDVNSITSDYKAIKVTVSWTTPRGLREVTLTSNAIPRGIETTAGGGTIRANIFDAQVNPVAGASVRFVNTSLVPPIDTTRVTGATGEAYLSGAPAGSGYEIFVTRSGYSTDQTYVATTSNPDPVTTPGAVSESLVSTMNFQIDVVSDVVITTRGIPVEETAEFTFDDYSQVATSSNITVSSGSVRLTDTAGVYESAGSFDTSFMVPAATERWDSLFVVGDSPTQTTRTVHVLYDQLDPKLVPDSDLPGNSGGFDDTVIDLRNLSGGTYPALAFRIVVSTTDTSVTPEIDEMIVRSVTSQSVLSGVPLTFTSSKVIGNSPGPIPKYSVSDTTDGSGESTHADIEWGQYSVDVSTTYSVAESCPSTPITIAPNSSVSIEQRLRASVPHSFRVEVVDTTDTPVPWAEVRLQQGAYDETQRTSLCGQTFFVVPTSALDYELTVDRFDFSTNNQVDIEISGSSTIRVILNP